MKFCPNCGNKLEKTASKYCPQCGGALKDDIGKGEQTDKAEKIDKASKVEKAREFARQYVEKSKEEKKKPVSPAASAARQSPPRSPKETIALIVLAFVLVVAFVFIAFYLPGAHWERVKAVGPQYYEYLTVFYGDEGELNALSNGYAALPLDNSTFSSKAAFASAYALNAKRALTSWNYFYEFLNQNDGLLRDYNVDAAAARNKIAAGRTAVEKEARSMRSELSEFAGVNANANASAAIAGVLSSLDEVGSA